jgi:hypothetical protein
LEILFPQIARYLYYVYLENKDSDGCAQLLEKEFSKIYGIEALDDGHDCNIVSMNSLNIYDGNDDCTSHDNDVSYKDVNFCGVNWECKYIPKRENRFCKMHKYLETKWLHERLGDCAERLNYLRHACGLCNERGHLNLQCKLFHD